MDTDSDAEAESVESEVSFTSSTSSCDPGALPHGSIDPATHFICPSDPEEFHKLIRLKREMVMEKMQLNPGVVFFDRIPDGFGLEQLRKFFSQYGRILRTRICDIDKKRFQKLQRSGSLHRTAYMEFARVNDARCAVQACAGSGIYDNLFRCSFMPVEKIPKNAFSGSHDLSSVSGAGKKTSKSFHSSGRSPRKRLDNSHYRRTSSRSLTPPSSVRKRRHGEDPLLHGQKKERKHRKSDSGDLAARNG